MRVISASLAIAVLSTNAQAREPAPAPAKPKQEKPICRSDPEIGSLVRAKKRCHSRADWDRMSEDGRGQAQGLTDGGTQYSPR